MTEQEKPERSLVVRSQETSLQRAGATPQFLEVGITPQFIENLGRVNNALVRASEVVPSSRLTDVSIALIPGKNPVIETAFRHDSGVRVYINSKTEINSRPKTTEILVKSESEVSLKIVVSLSDIQEFARKVFPDNRVILHGVPNPTLAKEPESLNPDLYSVTEEMLRPLSEYRKMQIKVTEEKIIPRRLTPSPEMIDYANEMTITVDTENVVRIGNALPYERFEVRAESEAKPIVTFRLFKPHYDPRVFCSVSELCFSGETEQAEQALLAMADLINRSFEDLLPHRK